MLHNPIHNSLDLLNFKYFFYVAYIVIGYKRSLSSGENKYLFFMLLGALGIATGILDYFVFSSNLELFVVADLVSLGFYFMFFYSLKTLRISGSLLLSTLSTLIVIAFVFFNIDWPKSDIHLYSNYGYLNTLEYLTFTVFAGLVCVIICTIVLIKMLKNDFVPLNLLFIVFGMMAYYVGDVIKSGLEIHFISDLYVHEKFLELFFPIRLFVSKGLIITGLLWKN